MGKRSNFRRRPQDDYRTTDPKAVEPLKHVIKGRVRYAEPCCGDMSLIHLLEDRFECRWASDIERRCPETEYTKDALDLNANDVSACDCIITNPPWTREILHPMIKHFVTLKPTWLLFDADWMHTKQAAPYLSSYCTTIAPVGRVKWFKDTPHTSKDNVCWYLFWQKRKPHHPNFIGRKT